MAQFGVHWVTRALRNVLLQSVRLCSFGRIGHAVSFPETAVQTDGTWTLLRTPECFDAANLVQTIEAKTAKLSLDVVIFLQVPAADCVGVTPYRIL